MKARVLGGTSAANKYWYLVEVVELYHGVRQPVQVAPKRRVQLQQRRVEGPIDLLEAFLGRRVDEEERGVPQEPRRQHLPT